MEIKHVSVMLNEVLNYIPEQTKIIIDGTLWHGWHSLAILEKFPNINKLIGIELDPNIFVENQKKFVDFDKKVALYNTSYTNISKILKKENNKADFILVDLGVNMEHFKDWSRGFSINIDGPLDMRFDTNQELDAKYIINNYWKDEMKKLFMIYADFGEWKAEEIAKKILEQRKIKSIETTFELKNIFWLVWIWHKTSSILFQAIRIETNKEMDNIKKLIEQLDECLQIWWIFAAITFHSIEDRTVKYLLKELCETGKFELITKKAIKPNYKEVEKNRASRSALLRLIKKVL